MICELVGAEALELFFIGFFPLLKATWATIT
jgi:hypothetical protein